MRTEAIIVALGLAVGCGQTAIGTVVRDVHMAGRTMVVERCSVMATRDSIELADCWREVKMLPPEIQVKGCPAATAPADAPPSGAGGVSEDRTGDTRNEVRKASDL